MKKSGIASFLASYTCVLLMTMFRYIFRPVLVDDAAVVPGVAAVGEDTGDAASSTTTHRYRIIMIIGT